MSMRGLFVLLVVIGCAAAFSGTALDEYVNFDDGAFNYRIVSNTSFTGYTLYVLNMTSQKWQTPEFSNHYIWTHTMGICVPNTVRLSQGLLFIDGGSDFSTGASESFIVPLCQLGGIVASIKQVPNQPIIFADGSGPLTEDQIIAHTFRSFLNGTGENPSQLLLFPMVKAAKRALDAVQDFAKTKIPGRSYNIQTFTVTGASKRGWTTWLLTAVDERVTVSIPIVLSLLNMKVNIPDVWRNYGEWGYTLDPYTQQHVFDFVGSPMFDQLAAHVDPLSYNDRLARVPKLVLDASMDQFFLLDSPKYFWNQLKGPKYLVVLPNADHYFSVPNSINTALQIVGSFYGILAVGAPLPTVSWSLQYSNSSSVTPNIVLTSSNVNQISSVQKYSITTTRPGFRDFRLNRCDNTSNLACYNYYVNGVQWTPVTLTPTSVNGNTATYQADLTNLVITPSVSDQQWTGFLIQVTYLYPLGGGVTLPLILTSEANIFPDFYPFPAHVPDYEAIGFCKTALQENKVNSWTQGSTAYSQWSVSLTVSNDLYAAQIEIDGPVTNLWGLDHVSGNLYSIPTYHYVNGKIPAGNSVSFGYITASANKAAVTFENNICYPAYSSDCSVAVNPVVSGQWSSGTTNYQSVNLNVQNTGSHVAPNTEITFTLKNGAYLSSVWNLEPKTGFPNTYVCPLYNLAPGQTSSSCGYIVAYTTDAATVNSAVTYCF